MASQNLPRPASANEKYQIYMRGWKDGAGGKPQRLDHVDHATLGHEYIRGFTDGMHAKGEASRAALERLKHTSSILRTM